MIKNCSMNKDDVSLISIADEFKKNEGNWCCIFPHNNNCSLFVRIDRAAGDRVYCSHLFCRTWHYVWISYFDIRHYMFLSHIDHSAGFPLP